MILPRLISGTLTAATLAALSVAPARLGKSCEPVRRAHYLMGTVFEITAYGDDRAATVAAIENAFQTIHHGDALLSHYREDSDLSRLNRARPGDPVEVAPQLHHVLSESLRFSELTGGAFDVTVGPLVKLWARAADNNRLPTDEQIRTALGRTGVREIQLLDHSRVLFPAQGRDINFGAIGKGWALDQALEVLKCRGIQNAFLSAGTSTIFALGGGPLGQGWRVGVRAPESDDGDIVAEISLRDAAVSTSASYELSIEIEGGSYSHIIDPRNGRPVDGAILSATVVAPTATEADVLSTAVFVLGPGEGAALLHRLGRAGLLVERRGPGASLAFRHISVAAGFNFVETDGRGIHAEKR